jgi:allophanate hydrolase
VAERYAAIAPFLARHARDMHPVTRRILEKAKAFSAADAFAGLYRLQALKHATEPVWRGIDALAVPTAPCAPTLEEVAADPIGPNARLGTFTNFVNLLDLAAIAVPGPLRRDGRAAGVTFIAPRGHDAALASLARVFHAVAATSIGATGRPLPPRAAADASRSARLSLRVGRTPSGMALNGELRAAGALPARAADTSPFTSPTLPGGPPERRAGPRRRRHRPCHRRRGVGAAPDGFGRFVAGIRRCWASARCCSPTAQRRRASCARPRPFAAPATSPRSAAGAPMWRPRVEDIPPLHPPWDAE